MEMNQQYWYDMNDIPQSNDFILMNYENTFIRIVANSNSGSDGFKFILRFLNSFHNYQRGNKAILPSMTIPLRKFSQLVKVD